MKNKKLSRSYKLYTEKLLDQNQVEELSVIPLVLVNWNSELQGLWWGFIPSQGMTVQDMMVLFCNRFPLKSPPEKVAKFSGVLYFQ